MDKYRHGTAAEYPPSQLAPPPGAAGTIPYYVGTAPGPGPGTGGFNIEDGPVMRMVRTYEEAVEAFGYSDSWPVYTLGEVIAAHFRNPQGNTGPVIMCNIWDPAKHAQEMPSNADFAEGLQKIKSVYSRYDVVPSIIAAPGFSSGKENYQAMLNAATKLNGRYDLVVFADLDADEAAAGSIEAAIQWKTDNGYVSERSKVFWPMAESAGKIYHASTLAVARSMALDREQDDCPCQTVSNKPALCTRMVLADGEPIEFDEPEANRLNAEGITAFNYSGGRWVFWGPHNANFKHGTPIDPELMFDTGVRVRYWLGNGFQIRNAYRVDSFMNRTVVDRIINDEQTILSALASIGRILYGRISFEESANSTSDMMQGNFTFDVGMTSAPVGKSLTVRILYTAEGLNVLFGGEAG